MSAYLHILLICVCGIKLNLLSNWILKGSTDGMLFICLLSITIFSFVWSPFLFTYVITWNLCGFTIIWFFLNQLFITSGWIWKILISFGIFSADNVLPSAKLCIDPIIMKKNETLIDRIKQRETSIEPWGTSGIINSNTLLAIWNVR